MREDLLENLIRRVLYMLPLIHARINANVIIPTVRLREIVITIMTRSES